MPKRISKKIEEKVIEKLSTTNDSLAKIGREVALYNHYYLKKIMEQSIKEGKLDPKYRRHRRYITSEEVGVLLEKLSTTHDSLKKIGKDIERSDELVKKIMNNAIQKYLLLKEQGLSDGELLKRNDVLHPKYLRLPNSIVQEQVDIILEKLSTTNDSLVKISKDISLDDTTVRKIMQKLIEEGKLDSQYLRVGRIVKRQVDIIFEKLSTTHDNIKKISKDIGLDFNAVRRIMEQLIEEGKLNPKYRRLGGGILQEQVDIVLEKLYTTTDNFEKIARYAGLSGATVKNIMKRAIQKYTSLKEQGLSEEELAQRKDVLHPRYKRSFRKFESSQDFTDYIKSDERLRETISAILSSFGENGHESKEYVFNHIVSRMIPGSVKFSVWSLGPYLGDITVGRSNLPAEDYIRRIPPEFLDQDPRLEHEFYKLLEKQVRRNFYDNPERTVSEIKQKADSEQNEFVKRLWCKLYDNLNDIQNYDLIRNANSRIPNPEYKGGKNYGKI